MSEQVANLSPNVSELSRKVREWYRGEYGRFASGPKSFDWLLLEPTVSDWIDGYTSSETREKKLYQLEKILKAGGFSSPQQLLDLPEREAKLLTRRVANWYIQNGKGVWAKQITITVRGFFEANDKRLEFKRSEKIRSPPRKKVVSEYIPSKTDIYKMADSVSSQRNKAILLSLFQSGVRVSCLCSWTFGLLQEQLYPEIRQPIRIKVTPAMDTKLNLYGLSHYLTGLQREAAQALRDYIEIRKEKGWNPCPQDWIFVTERAGVKGEKLRREGVWAIVKNVCNKSGFDPTTIWVHCFRKSFRKILNSTPQIDEDTKEALMGHKLPGSRGNYFDYHDEDEVMAKYMKAGFGRVTTTSLDLRPD